MLAEHVGMREKARVDILCIFSQHLYLDVGDGRFCQSLQGEVQSSTKVSTVSSDYFFHEFNCSQDRYLPVNG